MKSEKIKGMTLSAFTAATTAVLAQLAIPVPFGVPITLQTLAAALGGYLLGVKYGVISSLIYILLGALGVPVFSHLSGGIHYLFASPTGGFIFGFLFLSLFCGLSTAFKWKKSGKLISLSLGTVGILFCHLCGAMQYASVTGLPFLTAILTVSVPFLIKDIFLVLFAHFLSERLKKHMKIM